MKLDGGFARDIKKISNGDGSREARFDFVRCLDAAAKDLSSPDVIRGGFDHAIRTHGRVPVAICTAATIWRNRNRLDRWAVEWAQDVMRLWTNRTPSGVDRATISDGLHPTRIEEYAGSLIKFTVEDWGYARQD